MRKIKTRSSSISIFKLVLPLFILLFVQVVTNAQTVQLNGMWEMYNDKNVKFDKLATITQSGANLSINNGYGANSTAVLNGNTFKTSDGLTGTVSADGMRITWNIGYVWVKQSANNLPNKIEGETTLTPADSGMITRTITIKNNSGMRIYGSLVRRSNYDNPKSKDDVKTAIAQTELILGQAVTFGGNTSLTINEDVEFWIREENTWNKPLFKVDLPKNKDLTTFCYEVTGTYFVPYVKTCDGSSTYESKYISFKNEAGFNSSMSLTYYPTSSSTTKTATTLSTTAGYQTKLYLPMDADTNRQMTLKVNMDGTNTNYLTKDVSLNDFDTSGSTCYKAWGSLVNAKVSPCSLNTSARKIKLWNNAGYPATLQITYYDKDQSGKDVAKTVSTNTLEVTQTETIEVPQGTSNTPLKLSITNNWGGNKKYFFNVPLSADFTGELCYKVEGTAFAPTAATCDDTVGDTSGETRQIRFQNEAGYDAQMIVSYLVDEVINGQKMAMPKTLTTGMINGLGGKFRLITIPKNTSKGMPITITIQGNATVKGNDAIFSTTLPADFAASPQPCFKVWGTLLDPQGGKCNQ